MTTKERLSGFFDDFGFEMSDDLIEKCVDLCLSYTIDPKEFVELFVAFSVNQSTGTEASEATLDDFERKELTNYKAKPLRSNNGSTIQRNMEFDDEIGSEQDDNDVMGAYICTTPKAKKPNRSFGVSTPVGSLRSGGPAESPISVPLRDNPGKAVYTFGSAQLLKSINWTGSNKQTVKIERISDNLPLEQNYMYDNLLQKTSIAADRIYEIGEEICAKLIQDHPDIYDKDLYSEVFKTSAQTQDTIKCVGRICSDSDCQLDLHSTLLISADEISLRSYRLHFERMPSFSLFPGQAVYMEGTNPRGDTFFVDKIATDRSLTYADPPQVKEDMNVIVAAGPFTNQDDLIYEPLNDLYAYCKQHKPDVLILIGPFLDADHPLVQDGSITSSTDEFFSNVLSRIVINVGSDTEILVVASCQDVNSTAVYPTAPYAENSQYKNVTFLPDPCLVKVNGVTIGITATDIYNHILDTEIAVNAGDRVKRVTNYLFNQASFYPLNPPSDKVSVDIGLAQQFATLSIIPNILILKSNAKCFAREVKQNNERGCLVLNPGSMYENSANGTFSRLIVTPTTGEKTPLNNIIGCQIIKI